MVLIISHKVHEIEVMGITKLLMSLLKPVKEINLIILSSLR